MYRLNRIGDGRGGWTRSWSTVKSDQRFPSHQKKKKSHMGKGIRSLSKMGTRAGGEEEGEEGAGASATGVTAYFPFRLISPEASVCIQAKPDGVREVGR